MTIVEKDRSGPQQSKRRPPQPLEKLNTADTEPSTKLETQSRTRSLPVILSRRRQSL